MAGITSSCGSGTPSRLPTGTSTRSASRVRPTPGRRRACATAHPTSSNRQTSASSSRARCGRPSEISQHVARHGDAVKDIALAVPDATEAYRQAVQRGARGVVEPHWVEDEDGGVELAAIATYGDTLHTFVNRAEYTGAYLPGYRAARRRAHGRRRPARRSTTVVGNVELGQMNRLGRVLRAGVRDDGDDPLLRRGHLDRVLGADVEGDDGRRRARSSSRSTSRPRASARARSRSTSTSTAAPACSTSR